MRKVVTPRVNALLQDIRLKMESAWGPEGSGPSDAAAAASPGEGQAANPPTSSDALDLYLSEISDLLCLEYDMTDDEAAGLVYDAASELGQDIPDEEAPDPEVTAWMSWAKTTMFATQVMKRASELQ